MEKETRLFPLTWPYVSPCPGQIPIVASTIFPEFYKIYPTRESYVEAVDAGINTGLTGVELDSYNNSLNKILSSASKTGMNIILSQGILNNDDVLSANPVQCREFLTAMKYPEAKGFSVRDEPKFYELNSLGQKIRVIQNLLNSISSRMPLLVVNLVGEIQNSKTGSNTDNPEDKEDDTQGGLSYPAYLLNVWDNIRPQVWSSDYYPLLYAFDYTKKDGEGHPGCLMGTFFDLDKRLANFYNVLYYHALQSFRPPTGYSSRPFWSFCMTVGHISYYQYENMAKPVPNTMCPDPTIGQLRLEAFSALAFGAQGIRHWVYAKRANQDKSIAFLTAPIDRRAKKTAIWYTLQQLDEEIQRYSRVFLNAQFVNFGMFPKEPDVTSNESLILNTTCIYSVNVTDGRGVLVTHLKNSKIGYPESPSGISNFIIVVSRDPESTITLNIGFKRAYTIEELTPVNITYGDPVTFPPGSGSVKYLKRTLSPGSYLIFRYH